MDRKDIEQIIRKELVASVFESQGFIVAGNWKMNKTKREVEEFLDKVKDYDFGKKNQIIVFPTNPYLYLFENKLRYSQVVYGVQNFYPKEKGAYTGEISLSMAIDFGARYAIVGHSERRNIFGECDEFISKKIEECIDNKITPILCIGENLEQRKHEDFQTLLANQIKNDFAKIDKQDIKKIIIAYEPIWAIGTGETATPEQVEETHVFLRNFLVTEYGEELGRSIPLLYGGSVKPENVRELALADSVSGFLIGGASLDAESFIKINEILNGR